MDEAAFRATLAADGFDEVQERRVPAAGIAPEHTHDCDIRILVLDGTFILRDRDGTHHHGSGAVFEVPAGAPHGEGFGPTGAAYVAGRRYRR